MCGCNKSTSSAGRPLTTGGRDAGRWRVQFPSGSVKPYLTETEARVAAATTEGSVLLAPQG